MYDQWSVFPQKLIVVVAKTMEEYLGTIISMMTVVEFPNEASEIQ